MGHSIGLTPKPGMHLSGQNMPIRMKHPNHGYMHAYNTHDKAYLEGLGWSEEIEKPVEVTDEDEAIRQAYTIKFGKKPHHMMKIENILKALDDDGK